MPDELRASRGRPPLNVARDTRTMRMFFLLRRLGYTREKACERIAARFRLSYDRVYEIVVKTRLNPEAVTMLAGDRAFFKALAMGGGLSPNLSRPRPAPPRRHGGRPRKKPFVNMSPVGRWEEVDPPLT